MNEDLLLIVLLLLGLATHFLKRVVEERAAGRIISLRTYWVEHPYHSALAVASAVAGFVLLYGTAELTRITAWGLGYMADSAAGMLGKRAGQSLEKS